METSRIRALVDNLTTLDATLMKGQIGDCPKDRAKILVHAGRAEFVEGGGKPTPVKGDTTERAVSPARRDAETQTKKG